jgi:hypothetical protein
MYKNKKKQSNAVYPKNYDDKEIGQIKVSHVNDLLFASLNTAPLFTLLCALTSQSAYQSTNQRTGQSCLFFVHQCMVRVDKKTGLTIPTSGAHKADRCSEGGRNGQCGR